MKGLWHSKETREQLAIARGLAQKFSKQHGINYLKNRGWKLGAALYALADFVSGK